MSAEQERQADQAAYRRLKDKLAQSYPAGRYLAIVGRQVVADADRFQEIRATLLNQGYNPPGVLIVQAGAEYPERAVIFAQGARL
jgi:hypothetical protein